MTDDLDDLKSALTAATPAPDAARKAADLALAQKNFADLQEARRGPRPTSDRPVMGWMRGVAKMLTSLNSRALIGATTALVAVGLFMALPELNETGPRMFGEYTTTTSAPVEGVVATPEMAEAEAVTSAPEVLQHAAPAATGLRKDDAASLRGEVARSRMVAPAEAEIGAMADEVGQIMPAPGAVPVVDEAASETYPEAERGNLKIAAEEPVSTFSIDVDTASYATCRGGADRGDGQLLPL